MQNKASMNESKYSEAFYAQKDDKDYQIEIELEDGPNAEDPEKLTVIVGDEKETIEVPKNGTDDHYKKAIDAGLKKLGYKMVEGKLPSVNEGKYPVFVKIMGEDDYNKLVVPSLGDILKKGYSLDDIEGKWFELGDGEGKDYGKDRKKTMREIVRKDGTAEFIFWYGGDTLDTPKASEYVDDMGMDASDYGISFDDDTFETKKCEDSDGWKGWDDVADLEPTLDKIEQLTYELRSCVRGAYTGCNTWSELSDYIKGLASDLEAAGDNVSYKKEEND